MKLAVGYPVSGDPEIRQLFLEAVADHADRIGEVYFAPPGEPSGRSPSCRNEPAAQADFEADLRAFRRLGMKLDLALNANCYGAQAASARLADRLTDLIERIAVVAGLDTVTTASPFIASVVRDRQPDLEIRASVNMRLGTVEALDMAADLFDSFYAQRDFNRDPERLATLRAWCDRRGKRLCGLVNSGCLAFCPGQTFHDNWVAHEMDMSEDSFEPQRVLACRRYLRSESHWPAVLAATWIRPEDVHRYEGWFDVAKLATRMHRAPHRVLAAYARQRFRGNLLDLLEPGLGDIMPGVWLDNAAFPDDWFAVTSRCGRQCDTCDYCARVFQRLGRKIRAKD